MKCKKCQHELEKGVTLCPECGTENAEPASQTPNEGKKTGFGKIALALGILVALLVLLAATIMGGRNAADGDTETSDAVTELTEATDASEAVEATIPADTGLNNATCKGTYTGSNEDLLSNLDAVVATMGDEEMTVADLQVYYWLQVRDFLNSNDFYYLYYYYGAIDYTQPLDTQICYYDDTLTWQQYFVNCAISAWQEFTAMSVAAKENNVEMLPELREDLDGMAEALEETALNNGFADSQALLEYNMGPGATYEAYAKYMEAYYLGYSYYVQQSEAMIPTEEEVTNYFAENEAYFTEQGITKDTRTIDVRHVLIMPEGGTTDATGVTTYSDDEWAAAEAKAQALLDDWLAGDATEDTFAEMANANSADSDGTDGGLYTGVTEGYMVPEFNDWCFDESRQVGDYGLVKTTYGWHIMYFSGSDYVWYMSAEQEILYNRINEIMDEALAKYELVTNYSAVILGDVNLAA